MNKHNYEQHITNADQRKEGAVENIATKEEVIAALELAYRNNKNRNEEKRDLHAALLKFAKDKIWKFNQSHEINGKTAEDIVYTAIEKIIKCERKWNKDKCPNIVVLISGVVTSDIRHEIVKVTGGKKSEKEQREEKKKRKRRKIMTMPLYEIKPDGKEKVNNVFEEERARTFTEDDLGYFERDVEEMIDELERMLENNDVDFDVYTILFDSGEKKPSNIELAAATGYSVREIENAKKRIKRKALQVSRRSMISPEEWRTAKDGAGRDDAISSGF